MAFRAVSVIPIHRDHAERHGGRSYEGAGLPNPGNSRLLTNGIHDMCCTRYFTMLGALLAGLAVAAGAFGAHGLDAYFAEKYRETEAKTVAGVETPASEKYLNDFKTGVTYHMWHALGLIAVGLIAATRPHKSLVVAGWSFVLGIILFSGALYVLTIGGPRWLGVPWGAIAPIGGTLFIVGWVALAIGACPCGSGGSSDRLHNLLH